MDLAQIEDIDVVCLAGDVDLAVADRLGSVLAGLTEDSTGIVVDLSAVTLLDATIVDTLIRAQRQAVDRGVPFYAVAASGLPLEVLELTGAAKALGALLGRDEALAAITDPGIAGPTSGPASGSASGSASGPASGPASGSAGGPTGGSAGGPAPSAGTDHPPSTTAPSLADDVHALLAEAGALAPDDRRRVWLRGRAVERALPYARALAMRYRNRGEPTEDLLQVASLGLVKAVNGYDPSRETGFLAYAAPTILGELRRHFRDNGWAMQVPRRLQELRLEINQAEQQLTQALGRQPATADIADFMGIREAEVLEAQAAGRAYQPASLFAPTFPGDTGTLLDLLGSEDRALGMVVDRESVEPLLSALSAREQQAIALRFFGGMTQSQIAAELGTSQMQISRLLTSILGRLRKALLEDAEPAE
jgi:RNA polymerase sigma-B factor